MSNGVATGVRSGAWFRNVAAVLSVSLMLMSSPQRGQAQAADALPFSKGFLLTGSYVVGGVDLNPQAVDHGFLTGTIPMSGVPAGAEVVAAYLYWETISTNVAQVDGAEFRGRPVTVVKASSLPLTPSTRPCWSSGGGSGATYTMTMFRADVLHLLPIQLDASGRPTGHRLVNDTDLVEQRLRARYRHAPERAPATRCRPQRARRCSWSIATASQPLTNISLYDGIYVQEPGATMNQTIRGFYQSAAAKSAEDDAHRRAAARRTPPIELCFNDSRRSRPIRSLGSNSRSPIVAGRVRPTT